MPLRVELLEPGEAIPRGRGYVGVTDASPNAELIFPHVDSCLALALILDTGRLIGGHVPQQWHNAPEKNYSGCIGKILNLMEANRLRVGGEADLLIVAGHGNWWHGDLGAEAGTAMARWGADFFGVTTDDNAPKGVNVYVKPNSLTIERVHDHNRRVWNNLAGMRGTYKTSAF
jgi:hypothetical protein